MKIIYNDVLPTKEYIAINIFNIIFARLFLSNLCEISEFTSGQDVCDLSYITNPNTVNVVYNITKKYARKNT